MYSKIELIQALVMSFQCYISHQKKISLIFSDFVLLHHVVLYDGGNSETNIVNFVAVCKLLKSYWI